MFINIILAIETLSFNNKRKSRKSYILNRIYSFRFLVHCRTLYNLILAKYYANVTDHIFNENPDLNPEERILKELEQCERDIEEIEKAADSVVGVEGGGFIAMLNSKPNLGKIIFMTNLNSFFFSMIK